MSAISVRPKQASKSVQQGLTTRKRTRGSSRRRDSYIARTIARVNWTDDIRHVIYEVKSFFRDEIVGAVIDTIRLSAFIQSELRGSARRAARPLTRRVADAVEGNNLARDVVQFVGDGARVVARR